MLHTTYMLSESLRHTLTNTQSLSLEWYMCVFLERGVYKPEVHVGCLPVLPFTLLVDIRVSQWDWTSPFWYTFWSASPEESACPWSFPFPQTWFCRHVPGYRSARKPNSVLQGRVKTLTHQDTYPAHSWWIFSQTLYIW